MLVLKNDFPVSGFQRQVIPRNMRKNVEWTGRFSGLLLVGCADLGFRKVSFTPVCGSIYSGLAHDFFQVWS